MREEDLEDPEDFESDEMKPDISDRAPRRERSNPQKSKSQHSPIAPRQYLKIGIGIVVLLLLVFLITSALKAPAPQNNAPREISLGTASSDMTSQPAAPQMNDSAANANTADNSSAVNNNTANTNASNANTTPSTASDSNMTPPPISGTPTQAEPQQVPPDQKRVEIPGEITDALSAQQEQINRLKETEMSGTAPAAVTPAPVKPVTSTPAKAPAQPSSTAAHSSSTTTHSSSTTHSKTPASKPASTVAAAPKATRAKSTIPAVSSPATPTKSATAPRAATGLTSIPGNRVTLQVSSASRSDTLQAFAKKNGMKEYWVYPTRRDGKAWYVLVTGNYASAAEARAALSGMSAEVKANKPWVRSMQQVHQDLKQK
ncbi:MAG: SPOR domain-containing protein [Enterobacteriaceae bacterium]|nr:SPOR domain-containing protein [Enterobacteriaceae bacterium]